MLQPFPRITLFDLPNEVGTIILSFYKEEKNRFRGATEWRCGISPFSSHLQSFPASGSFPMSQLYTSGGQSTGVSSFNISPSNEHSGLISFRMDWLDLLAVQGTLKSLLQHHSSKVGM